MHNISIKEIQDLAQELAQAASTEESRVLLEKARNLYEKILIFDYNASREVASETVNEIVTSETTFPVVEDSLQEIKAEKEEKEMTVQERIAQIMANAPKVDKKPIETISFEKEVVDKTSEPTGEIKNLQDEVEVFIPETPEIESKDLTEKEVVSEMDSFFETQKQDFSSEKEVNSEKELLKTSLEEEFKDSISADYAADLFEKADKVEITKKSLNDLLSQNQIQIGLNDRIAFVKHLFDGSQVEFNRVLSQLNSFTTEEQAKSFIATRVKPDYNWSDEEDYEVRFMQLIERRFL